MSDITCISFTGIVTQRPAMMVKFTVNKQVQYYIIHTNHCKIGDSIDVHLNDTVVCWSLSLQTQFKTIKPNISTYANSLTLYSQKSYKDIYNWNGVGEPKTIYICKADMCLLVKKWTILDSIILVKKSNNRAYRWTETTKHPLLPHSEYIGTFKTKKDIKVPPKRTVAYNCAMCRHSQCGMGLKEIKGIDSDCCICLENKASILCTNCSAIHACLECVTKQCKLVPLVK